MSLNQQYQDLANGEIDIEEIVVKNIRPKESCRIHILPNKGSNVVRLCLLSDIHLGSKFCDVKLVRKLVSKCVNEKIYVILGGDLIEFANKFSIGAGMYEQIQNPTDQIFELMDILQPLVDSELLLSIISGNHEDRAYKVLGIEICALIAKMCHISYMGSGGFHYLKLGNEKYTLYYEHGFGGSRYTHTKMKKVIDASKNVEDCDVFAHAHMHDLVQWKEKKRKYNRKNKIVEYIDKLYLITGGFLKYQGSYAQKASFPITVNGSPILNFYTDKHKVDVEFFPEDCE